MIRNIVCDLKNDCRRVAAGEYYFLTNCTPEVDLSTQQRSQSIPLISGLSVDQNKTSRITSNFSLTVTAMFASRNAITMMFAGWSYGADWLSGMHCAKPTNSLSLMLRYGF